MRVTRQVLYWFEPKESIEHFREEQFPVYVIEEEADRKPIYGFPLTGPISKGVKVALHGSDEVCTPDSICRDIRPADERSIRDRLAETLPGLAGRLLYAETCLYTITPDEHFLLGSHPHHPDVTIAAGFSGHGFKFTPVIGEVVTEMISKGSAALGLDLFSLNRFKPAVPVLNV